MTKARLKRYDSRWRDSTTDEAIVGVLAQHAGDMHRRELLRILGHRHDFASAQARLVRGGSIELVTLAVQGKRPQPRVRLIGKAAQQSGAGFVHLTKRRASK